ncbi:lipopolysaccharide biosynthesis protein [Nocardioides terrigena]|uniref:lipopolysaccharide biosynthesis protein n=1 Tax=Nocardioides terrigena TaxID=424797 RepID=UPI00131EF606|nr:hypothetical protein [Nocardioides terrigena]
MGNITGVTGIALFTIIFVDLGVSSLFLKKLSQQDEEGSTASLRLAVWTSLAAPPLTFAIAVLLGIELALIPFLMLCLWPALEKLIELPLAVRISQNSLGSASTLTVLRRLTPLVLQVLFMQSGVGATMAYCAALAIGALLVLAGHVGSLKGMWRRPRSAYGHTLHESIHLYISATASQSRELEVPIVAFAISPAAGALYAVGFRLARPMALIGSALAQMALADAATRGADAARGILRQAIAFAASGVALIILFSPLLPDVLAWLLGEEYRGAASVCIILLATATIAAATAPASAALQGLGHEKYVGRLAVLTQGVSLAALAVVGATFGLVLGAVTVLLSTVARLLLTVARLRSAVAT